jgi:hypothetical protein
MLEAEVDLFKVEGQKELVVLVVEELVVVQIILMLLETGKLILEVVVVQGDIRDP